ncbi:helix-turn-helix domain-containing protein [Streptomyces umbrinus]|uniref:helix-turn-helix domain-containing protein n=1 Tax=Streptomyces umbrinus TaxID=67370 RepID=UPI0027D7C3D8|nr:helix-turn-helix domain-containing protein [Streptomyces umbrinus]
MDRSDMDGPPTLDDVRSWPATVSVKEAATALGISKSQLYDLIRTNEAPLSTIRVGTIRVITSSLVKLLDGST